MEEQPKCTQLFLKRLQSRNLKADDKFDLWWHTGLSSYTTVMMIWAGSSREQDVLWLQASVKYSKAHHTMLGANVLVYEMFY